MSVAEDIERLLADEQFGVLGAHLEGRIHLTTLLFAHTDALEIVWLARPETRHARAVAADPMASFQVDSRHVVAVEGPDAFRRAQLWGEARVVPVDSAWGEAQFAKHPGTRAMLDLGAELYALTPTGGRFAVGMNPSSEVAL